jgi:predicted ATP-dependent protease
MNEERVAEALAAYVDETTGHGRARPEINLTDEERRRLAPLVQLSKQLQQNMKPVSPSAAFVRSLGRELTHRAEQQIALTKRLRRAIVIGAAALGSLLSIASVVGAIVLLIARLRARARARALHTAAGQTEGAPA